MTLRSLGHLVSAGDEARRALETFVALNAAPDAGRARALLDLDEAGADQTLTARQIEVLRLAASGLTNREIAARLVVSEHTVKRHIANILVRLGQPSRAAAVADAARRALI